MLIKTSKTSGHIDKRVSCEQCGSRYLYRLARTKRAFSIVPLVMLLGTIAAMPVLVVFLSPCLIVPLGGGFILVMRFRTAGVGPLGSLLRASGEAGDEDCDISANKKLREALLNGAEPVPCPKCGWYQKDMVREYRSRQYSWLTLIGVAVLLLSQGVAYWLMAMSKNRVLGPLQAGPDHKVQSWLICVSAGGLCVFAAILLRWLFALRRNPNNGFPDRREPVPGAPPAVSEADYNANIAAATAKITARRPIPVDVRAMPRRRLPPPP
jgi:hypothetical protein